MKIIHLWDLLRLILRDSHIRQSAKEALYYFTRLEETDSDNFSQGIFAWAKRLTEVQPYVYRELQSSQLPNNLSLIDDYGKVRALIEAEMAALPYQPLFTFIVPFYGGSSRIPRFTPGFVSRQTFSPLVVFSFIYHQKQEHKHEV